MLDGRPQPSLVLVCGPSATGKTRLVNELVATFPRFRRPTSFTTRLRRPDEADGEYSFVTEAALEGFRREGRLLNYDEVYGHHYAIDRASVDSLLGQDLTAIKEVHPAN